MAQVKALIGNIKGKDGIANVYNTSETVIGTWNGSTLYRKMIYITVPSTPSNGTLATASYPLGISYTKIKSVYINEMRKDTYTWSTAGLNGSGDSTIAYVNGTNLIIDNYNTFNNSVHGYAVIEYVK